MSRAATGLFAFLVLLAAGNPASALPADQIAFAVPATGRITLGVFDKTGKPVRILHALDGEESFQVGLNGFITSWDGLDDEGRRLPSGTYHIRGYLVGEVEASGEAFHFNDWITDENSPALEILLDFDTLPDGDVVLLGKTPATTVCARVSLKEGFRWVRETPGRALLACNAQAVILDDLSALSLADGEPLAQARPDFIAAPLAASESTILAGKNSTLALLAFPDGQTEKNLQLPHPFTSADLRGDTLLGGSPEGVWISRNASSFEKITLPAAPHSVSLGEGDTFWFCGTGMDPDQTPLVGQSGFSGEILRVLLTDPGDPVPKKIRASKSSDGFVVLEESPGLQRLRALSRDSDGAWIIDWEKTIRRAPEFGFVDGEISADASTSPQTDSLRFRLEENPLTGERQTLTLRVVADSNGTRLVNEDGLPLLRISERPGIRRIAIHRGKTPDSLRVLQGDGACVEEFLIEGLRHILPLNAGEIEIR